MVVLTDPLSNRRQGILNAPYPREHKQHVHHGPALPRHSSTTESVRSTTAPRQTGSYSYTAVYSDYEAYVITHSPRCLPGISFTMVPSPRDLGDGGSC